MSVNDAWLEENWDGNALGKAAIMLINNIGSRRHQTAAMLKNIGFENISSTSELKQAISLLKNIRGFRIVLLEMNSTYSIIEELNFLAYLNQHRDLKSVKVIASAESATRTLIMSLSAIGLKSFILKNPDFSEYERAVRNSINQIIPLEYINGENIELAAD